MRFAVGRSDAGDDLFILQMKKSAAPTMLVLQAMTNALQCHPGSTVTLRSDFAFMGRGLYNFLWFLITCETNILIIRRQKMRIFW